MVQPQAPFASLSREQLGLVIRTKKQFYNAMLQDGYVMPGYKQTLVSIKFMHAVRNKEVWAPRAEDVVQCRMVAYPPSNDVLKFHIGSAVDQMDDDIENAELMPKLKRLMELLKKKSADKEWLLRCLFVLDENHAVFQKNYRYVKPRTRVQPNRIQLINNEDGFYDNLPPLQPNELRRRLLRMSKADKQLLQMETYKARQHELNDKVERLRRQMAGPQEEEDGND